MPEKRPFPDTAAGDHAADNGLGQAPRGPRGPKRMRPSGSNLPLHAPEGGGAKANLKRIRDLKRTLSKADLPATVRADMEKELQARHDRRGEKKVSAKRANMISRYHMVRFFERKKAGRRLKQIQKALAATDDAEKKAIMEEQIRILEVDIAYTQYHPHLEPYISLYVKNKKNEGDDGDEDNEEGSKATSNNALQGDDDPFNKPDMWHTIEEAMKEGPAVLEKIRDRKNAAAFLQAPLALHARPKQNAEDEKKDRGRGQPREKPRKKDVQRSGHWQEAAEAEEEDDGEGFFE